MAVGPLGFAQNLFSRFRKPDLESKSSLACPEAWLSAIFGATPAASGIAVNARTAMTCAPMRCGVQAIAEAIGQLPVHVYQRNSDGSKERAADHPAHKILHDDANEWTPASGLREQVTRDALLYREGGFAFINRIDGKPVELIRLDPERMTVDSDPTTGEPTYTLDKANAAQRQIARQDILHIPSPSLTGCGLLHDGREAIALALVMERHAAHLFGRGARPAGVLKFDGKLGDDTATRIKASWQAAHGGSNSGGTAVLEEGGEFIPITFNSVDAQFLELRLFQISEIARLLRVPPVFLQEFGRATWSNSAEMGRQFVTFCLMPWIKRWEGEIRLKLFTPEERNTFHAEFLMDDFLRADFSARMAGYATAIASRTLSPNEARALENRPAYAGGEKFENPNTSTGAPPNA